MTEDDFIGIVAICGEEGTCKTTMALTFPKVLSHLDIDVGGFKRAAWRLDVSGVESHSFPKPLTDADIAKMKGIVTTNPQASTRALAIPKKIEGMKELWQTIINQIVKDALNPELKTIVIDSATMHYKAGCEAYLQELQEKQLMKWTNDPKTRSIPFNENDYREKLLPIEYGTVYDRLQRIYHTCRSYKKNLILIHYPTEEYGTVSDARGNMVEGKTGKVIMDGYKDTPKFADLIMWLSIKEVVAGGKKDKHPTAKITKCGLEGMGLDAVGLDIPATYEGIINLQRLMRGE